MLAWDKHMNRLLISAFYFYFFTFLKYLLVILFFNSVEAIIIKLKLSNN